MSLFKEVTQRIEPQPVIEGAGVLLRRSIAPHASNPHDPFLLFDHFAFNDPAEGPIRGFPTHPHRGIETVTYMLEGSVRHRDSLGNTGSIGSGDVQWMTSGRGILHEEMPRRSPQGSIDGFQLWVNLPSRLKMSQPRYQEVVARNIPTVADSGVCIRVVAGEANGVTGPVTGIAARPLYLDVTLDPKAGWVRAVPSGDTTLAYVFEGAGRFSGQEISAVHMVRFGDGEKIQVQAGPEGVRFMLIAGSPFREPIVPYGPFVMNTREEIQQALIDLRNGTFVQE
ncbi:MAG: pirin family protein [Anaerolineales bacterium]|nr:pirin family protein [Anaerolineales bacterium]